MVSFFHCFHDDFNCLFSHAGFFESCLTNGIVKYCQVAKKMGPEFSSFLVFVYDNFEQGYRTFLVTSCKHFGFYHSWFHLQTSRPGFCGSFGKGNEFTSLVISVQREVFHVHVVVLLPSAKEENAALEPTI